MKVTTTISKNPPGRLLVLLHLLLAQRLLSTPRICFLNPPMLPVKGVVRVKFDVSEKKSHLLKRTIFGNQYFGSNCHFSLNLYKNTKITEPAEYEDADDGAQGEDKEELVPRLLVKDVGKSWGTNRGYCIMDSSPSLFIFFTLLTQLSSCI